MPIRYAVLDHQNNVMLLTEAPEKLIFVPIDALKYCFSIKMRKMVKGKLMRIYKDGYKKYKKYEEHSW